jgi:hypothetical protein
LPKDPPVVLLVFSVFTSINDNKGKIYNSNGLLLADDIKIFREI